MFYFVTITMFLVVAAEYPTLRNVLVKNLSSVDAPTSSAVFEALRKPMRRFFLAWLLGVAVCGAIMVIVLVQLLPEPWALILLIQAIYLSLLAAKCLVFRRVDRELLEHGFSHSGQPLQPNRAASLEPRESSSYLPRPALALPWLLAIGATAFLLWRAIDHPPVGLNMWAFAVAPGAAAWLILVVFTRWLRDEITWPYPVDVPKEAVATRLRSNELVRRFRVLGIYGMTVIAMVAMFELSRIGIETGRDDIPFASVVAKFGEAAAKMCLLVGFFALIWGLTSTILYLWMMRTNENALSGRATKQ